MDKNNVGPLLGHLHETRERILPGIADQQNGRTLTSAELMLREVCCWALLLALLLEFG